MESDRPSATTVLGQFGLSPVSVPAPIAILLPLNAALFDPVPLALMAGAQRAVETAAGAARRRTRDKTEKVALQGKPAQPHIHRRD